MTSLSGSDPLFLYCHPGPMYSQVLLKGDYSLDQSFRLTVNELGKSDENPEIAASLKETHSFRQVNQQKLNASQLEIYFKAKDLLNTEKDEEGVEHKIKSYLFTQINPEATTDRLLFTFEGLGKRVEQEHPVDPVAFIFPIRELRSYADAPSVLLTIEEDSDTRNSDKFPLRADFATGPQGKISLEAQDPGWEVVEDDDQEDWQWGDYCTVM